MKVLLLIDSLGPGGAQRQLVGLAVMLKQQGHNVVVATYHDNRFYVDTLLDSGVPYVYLKNSHGVFKRVFCIAKYIRTTKPDWVISYLETPSIIASLVRVFNHRFKLIVSERNTTQVIRRNEVIRFNLFRYANYVVPNAYAQKNFIVDNFPFLVDKIKTIANFVDTNYFCPVQHKRHGISKIVIAASIWSPKNTLTFIKAVRLMKDKGAKFHVSWYGKVDSNIAYFNDCIALIKELGVETEIELLDKTKSIKDKYQDADFFVLPSFYEGTPNVICEAMACGLPIACSNVCDNPIYVKQGINGVLFNPKSAESMANAVIELLSIDDSTYNYYCANSRKIAIEKLTPQRFVDNYLELME
ncbi:UNVERIFIED_CONTAM: glycosyltransferase family 4 protein [Prevotella sp. 15_C9]